MDLNRLTKLEEIHYPVETQFFSEDGLGEEWVDVCANCDDGDDQYAVLWPCPTMQGAYYAYEEQDNLRGPNFSLAWVDELAGDNND